MNNKNISVLKDFLAVTEISPTPISGVYCGELPGNALGKLKPGNIWITACANINSLAVAFQMNAACIIAADNPKLSPEFCQIAKEHGITVFKTTLSSYETAVEIYHLISE